jgi:hypothetical protein
MSKKPPHIRIGKNVRLHLGCTPTRLPMTMPRRIVGVIRPILVML